MDQYLVAWDGVMTFEEDESAEDVLDRVMENLLASNLIDPTLEFTESTGRVAFETIATGTDVLAAVVKAATAYRGRFTLPASAPSSGSIRQPDWSRTRRWRPA